MNYVNYGQLLSQYVKDNCPVSLRPTLTAYCNRYLYNNRQDIEFLRKELNNYNNNDSISPDELDAVNNVVEVLETMIINPLWSDAAPLNLTLDGLISKYICDDSSSIEIFQDFIPSSKSFDYFATQTNGGLFESIKDGITSNYVPRLDDIKTHYDASKNQWYKKPIQDASHIRFALSLAIWRNEFSNETRDIDDVRDRFIIDERNKRIHDYYQKLIEAAQKSYHNPSGPDEEYFIMAQMLDDIMWDPRTDPDNSKVRLIFLSSYINKIIVRPDVLKNIAGKLSMYNDLCTICQAYDYYTELNNDVEESNTNNNIKLNEELNEEGMIGVTSGDVTIGTAGVLSDGSPVESSSDTIQEASNQLIDTQVCIEEIGECSVRNVVGKIDSDISVDLNLVMCLCKYVEVNYLYGTALNETSTFMINARERMLNYLFKNIPQSFMRDFAKSPYYDKYCELNAKINSQNVIMRNICRITK